VPQANIMAFEKSSWLMYPITSRTDATSLLFLPQNRFSDRQRPAGQIDCWSAAYLLSTCSRHVAICNAGGKRGATTGAVKKIFGVHAYPLVETK
jgi:hypothetical protein